MVGDNIWLKGTTKWNEKWVSIDVVLYLYAFILAKYFPIILELLFTQFYLFVGTLDSVLFYSIFLCLD